MEGHCQVFSEFSQFTCLCINIGTKICLWKILVWEIDLLTFSSLIFIYFPGLEILPTICQNLDFATVSRSWNFNFCCQPVGTWNSWTFLFVPLYFMSTCCHLSLIFECCCSLLSGLIQSFFPDLFKFCVSSFFFHSHYHWKAKASHEVGAFT